MKKWIALLLAFFWFVELVSLLFFNYQPNKVLIAFAFLIVIVTEITTALEDLK
jgi:hypothetical protein